VQWLHILAQGAASVSPLDSASDSVVGYILGFGPLGIVALALAWLTFKGWRLISPAGEAAMRDAARNESRADLLAERDRLLTEKQQAEDQRDEALTIARDQLTPLLQSFVATTSVLVPILQEIIRDSPARRRRGGAGP
jgi:hypothetical protein